MGVNLKDLTIKKEISIEELKNKKLVIDGNNILYQFLSSIRQIDGTPLMDSEGRVTSHLTGLFYRTTKLMQKGLKLCFVFDGKAPELKYEERERRAGIKKEAMKRYEEAKKEGNVSDMQKYAKRTSRLTKEMIKEATELIQALGLPTIEAPSEGEAQAAYMVKKGDAYAEISQDYDCLLFGVPRMIQNLTISERKKRKDKLAYETIKPQIISLEENLKQWGITREQLIVIGILIGTDFDVGGIKGIGPKKAFELVKKHEDNFDKLFEEVGWDAHFNYPWRKVYKLFTDMPTNKDYRLEWNRPDADKVREILVERHEFGKKRTDEVLEKLERASEDMQQKGLGDFF